MSLSPLIREAIHYSLLFILIFGMSATVDSPYFRTKLTNRKAIGTGALLQFIVLPLLGFVVVKILELPYPMGITLLVLTSSPSGSYSNWWCSIFNADLALSIAMTIISTLLSIFMIPLNLLIYATNAYSSDIVDQIDWVGLYASLAIVISAAASGLFCSSSMNSIAFNRLANRMGNLAGMGLVVYSVVIWYMEKDKNVNETSVGDILWGRDWKFYFGVSCPCIFGLLLSNSMATYLELRKPERISVSVESCFQNIGIAASVAINMFGTNGDSLELEEAIAVPLYYGLIEAALLGLYCILTWKIGWSKAPREASIFRVLWTSFELVETRQKVINEDIEVVLGSDNYRNKKKAPDKSHERRIWRDLIFFSQYSYGGRNMIVDPQTLNNVTMDEEDEEWLDHGDDPTKSRILKGLDIGNDSLAADGLSLSAADSDLDSGVSLEPADQFEDNASHKSSFTRASF